MTQGISAVLTFAVGVAISPVPIIAVILMLFSSRAKVNGPIFLLGWAGALAVVSFAVYFAAGATDPTTSDAAADTITVCHLLAAAPNVQFTWRATVCISQAGSGSGFIQRTV